VPTILDEAGTPILDEAGNPVCDEAGCTPAAAAAVPVAPSIVQRVAIVPVRIG
jgi:hypothetical protein